MFKNLIILSAYPFMIKLTTKSFYPSFHNWIRFKFRGVQFSSNRMIASQHYTHVQL